MTRSGSKTQAPFGSWRSPIAAAALARSTVSLGQLDTGGTDLYWQEVRPAEGGRTVIVHRSPDGSIADLTPEGFNVRTRVHEYGGGAYRIRDGVAFFAEWSDQRLYRQDPGSAPVAITPEPPGPAAIRYADIDLTPDGRLLACVRESHVSEGEPTNEIVVLPADGSADPRVLVSGNDFFSFPRVAPDGRKLAWTTWSHPNMPWDGTELWVAQLSAEGELGEPELVAGGRSESIFQPAWSPEGVLYFVSDRTGWWNLYRYVDGASEPIAPVEAELGMPQWVFGMSTYAFLSDGSIACAHAVEGVWRLGVIPPGGGEVVAVETPYTSIGFVQRLGDRVVFVGAGPTQRQSVVVCDPSDGGCEVVRRSSEEELDPADISTPEVISFPSDGDRTAHAFFYPPKNKDFEGPSGERPPLLVLSHGGPTGQVAPVLNPSIQYWTTRGFAIVDVNYGGSTGYGRPYRDLLKEAWGIVDVADCVAAARYLAKRGEVDASRMAIRGGSAGGYATLAALAFHDVFAAGANYFGVADLEALAAETHKFESRYLDTLVGPYPERRDLYLERSPVHHADGISCPLITFQGLEDEVVPPAQSEAIVEALRRKGLPYAYVTYEGEQHGFRRAENIQHSLETELSFYGQILGFEPADGIEPVRIENLKA